MFEVDFHSERSKELMAKYDFDRNGCLDVEEFTRRALELACTGRIATPQLRTAATHRSFTTAAPQLRLRPWPRP